MPGSKQNGNCTLYIVRHGETDWNVKKLMMGHTDVPLNKNGEIQAKELGNKLKNIHFDAVYSSDLLRTERTAELVLLERDIAIQTTKMLRERNFGRLEGKSWGNPDKEMKQLNKKIAELTKEERKIYSLEDVENNEDIVNRFIPYIREISVANMGKTILVTTHGGVMRIFLIRLGIISKGDPLSINIKNTSYIKLESDGVEFFVKETFGIEKS